MRIPQTQGSPKPVGRKAAAAAALVLVLTSCGPATLPPGDQIVDRDEVRNRAVHEMNLRSDRRIVSPAADAYGTVPEPIRVGVSNFASNLSQPSYVVNNLLQLRLDDAAQNTLRFAINSTLGVAGLFDVATALGVPAEATDFGETLHVLGVGEGAFVMHPVIGPSTTRDTVGIVVDHFLDPVGHFVAAPESGYLLAARAADRLGSRYQFDATIDSIYYESADSYAQLRSLYLQQRRFELRGGAADYEDPYAAEDPADDAAAVAADPYYDPYSDPYFDPYAQ